MDPFTAFAIFAAVFLAVGFLYKIKPTDAAKAALSDFTFPRSNEGDPLNIAYGTVKLLSPNTLYTGAFEGVALTQKVSTGLFSSKRVITGYDYYIGMQLGLCLGPNVRVRKIWFGKHLAWQGTLVGGGSISLDLPNLFGGKDKAGGVRGTVSFFSGDVPQTQSAQLAAWIGPEVPAYNGLAYLVFGGPGNRGFYWGKSQNIEAVSVEIDVFNNTLGIPDGKHIMANGLDVNPAEILYDLCVTEYGKLGINPDRFDKPSFIAAALTLYTENHYMSLQISNSARGAELIQELLKQINGALYQEITTGKFVLGLQRQDYDPLTIPLIDVDNLSEISNYTRNLWSDTVNQIRVKFKNRANNYMDNSPAMWQDMANISLTGQVRSSEVSHPGCYDGGLATYLATRTGAMLSIPLFSADIKVNRAVGQAMRPNSVFRLNCRRLGIRNLIMRVREVDLGEYADSKVLLSCFQDIYASRDVTITSPDVTQWERPDNSPGITTVYAVIGTPFFFVRQADSQLIGIDEAEGLIWVLPRRSTSSSQTFYAYVSQDGFTTNTVLVENVQYSGAAKLEDAYGASVGLADGFDNSGTGIIIYDLDGAYLPETSTDTDIRTGGANLMLIDGEILAYRTVTSLGGGRYRLTNIRRALLDTTFEAHSADADVLFLSSADGISLSKFAQDFAGDVRITDVSATSGVNLADAPDIPFVMDKRTYRPSPPAYVTLGGVRQPATVPASTPLAVDFYERNRMTDDIKFYDEATSTPEAGTDYVLRWRVDGGSWTDVDPFTKGANISIGATLGLLEVEVWSRVNANLSRVAARATSTVV